jgi:hypothetical protein
VIAPFFSAVFIVTSTRFAVPPGRRTGAAVFVYEKDTTERVMSDSTHKKTPVGISDRRLFGVIFAFQTDFLLVVREVF